MKKILGMSKKDLNTLSKIMKFEVTKVGETSKTVEQAINDGDVKIIGTRISKKGVELVKLSNGKEFEKKNLATTTFFS